MQDTPFRRVRTIQVAGEKYQIHPLSIDDMMVDMQAWLDTQFPDPFDVVGRQIDAGRIVVDHEGHEGREPYPMAVQQFMIRTALETSAKGRPRFGTPDADEMCQTAAGVAEMMFLSIRKGRPDFTRDQARDLYRELTLPQVTAVFAGTNADQVMSDPKEPGADGTLTA